MGITASSLNLTDFDIERKYYATRYHTILKIVVRVSVCYVLESSLSSLSLLFQT